jgi:predicted type IV restriction endonuclease
MSRAVSPEKLTLRDLKSEFKLENALDTDFFLEWQQDLPLLSEWEQQRLDRIYASYLNHNEDGMLEETLKLAIVSPLLDLADFFLPPFRVSAEEQMQLVLKDQKKTYRGKIDILVLKNQMWILVIEARRQAFSLSVGIPQVLAYMLSNSIALASREPIYGMVTNGSNFVFLKMMRVDGGSIYGKSDELLIEKKGDRVKILQILKQIGRLIGGADVAR